jgi:molecular chaperone GrpE
MAEEKRRQIPIEDGNAEEELREEQTEETTEEAKADTEAEPQKSEEAGEDTAAESETGGDDKSAEDQSAEDKTAEEKAAEQESERYMRLMAEFQNFKRRAAKEKSDIHAYANEKIISDLLPVLDNFERALSTDASDAEGYRKGMELIFQQLQTALEKAGLKEIPALGEEFDPKVHNAVMTEDSEEHDDGKISKVLQKGYTLNDKVVRPSMVAVVRK